MASSIDITKPITGNPTTQSVRDNFSSAKTEIEALQTDKADLASPTFTGTVTAADLTATGTVTSANITGTGTITFTGATVADLGSVTTCDINGGAIDGATVGSTTPAAGAFTTLTASSTATFGTVDINGGAIDGTPIGATSASTGAFTTLTASSTATFGTVDINGGAIDGTPIGATSASTGAFTTISASGAVTASSTLNVSTASNLQVEGSSLVTGFKRFRTLTQATYDGLTPDSDTLYFING